MINFETPSLDSSTLASQTLTDVRFLVPCAFLYASVLALRIGNLR